MDQLEGSERLILQAILDSPIDSAGFVQSSKIAEITRTSIHDVELWLKTLEAKGFVEWAKQIEGLSALLTEKGKLALGRTLTEHVSITSDSRQPAVKVVPKGLRSFDEHDKDFFIELLPGPRRADGLPESISFWKVRIEETDPDRTFKVGVIIGPSGCGKSSLVKAGLIPRLCESVIPVFVEATENETEARLLKVLQKRLLHPSPDLDLPETISALLGNQGSSKKKILIVLDQFEQWLQAKPRDEETPLEQALSRCDGEGVQAILMIRDDFWMAVTRFMGKVGIALKQWENFVAVDLFDQRHAKKVLTAFGQAFGALPDRLDDLTKEQREFLDQTVVELAQDGRIISVRLALFAEMVKTKSWTPATLNEMGGTSGVGVRFLEGTFSSKALRPHQAAAKGVLKALLPESSSNITGHMRSHEELLEASGYSARPKELSDLIQILDKDVRLIAPTDPEGFDDDNREQQSTAGLKYYQLTHDYLVPSIRDWLVRKQKETRRGRAEIQLADRSAIWTLKNENRQLPSLLEFAKIRLLTKKQDWSEPERRMMKRAGRMHGVRGLTLATVVLVLVWGGYELNDWLRAQMFRDKLLASPLADVPGVIIELKPYRKWVDPLLKQAYAEAKKVGNSQKQLNAALGLLPVDDAQVTYLKDRLLRADARDISVIRQSLAGHKDTIVADCWTVLQNPTLGDKNSVLQAASALALYDPENPLWAKVGIDVANRLVAESAYVVSHWIDALRPVSKQLCDPLIAVFRDEERGEFDRTQAASALAEYGSDRPELLAGLLMDATEKQFAILYPSVERKSDQTASILERGLAEKPPSKKGAEPTEVDNKDWDKFYKQQANAGVALIRMGRMEKLRTLLKHSPDPSLRSYLVHRLGTLGVEPGILIAKLYQESDVSVRRALILSLGEYGASALLSTERNALTKRLTDLYRNDPDPGIHGAAEWLLRQWWNEKQIKVIDKELEKLPLPTVRLDQEAGSSEGNNRGWYINTQGQTMVIVRGPVDFEMGEGANQRRERIGHHFAIAAKEVTLKEFQSFQKENPSIKFRKEAEKNSSDPTCPMNSVSWYDATAYCNWLSKQEGLPEEEWCYNPNEPGDHAEAKEPRSIPDKRKGYRLPTVAEWEFSCRAGAMTFYSFGEPWAQLEKYGWYEENSHKRMQPVGRLKPNDLGLFDLHGNVCEWCQDRYKDSGRGDIDPRILESIIKEDHRLLRGGSLHSSAASVRSAFLDTFAPENSDADIGFRPARTLP